MLRGKIESVSIASIIQLCNQDKKNGILQISKKENKIGEIYFKNGEIIAARIGELKSIEAFKKIFNLKEGDFVFLIKNFDIKPEIEVSCEFLLLEAMSKQDEEKKIKENLFYKLNEKYDVKEIHLVPDNYDLISSLSTIGDELESGNLACAWLQDDDEIKMIVKKTNEKDFIEFDFKNQTIIEDTFYEIKKLLKEV
ncbi:DUF4388 domain-containing protein [Desulfohalobiaceae bacterium Ax17]|uniref:DUF4388 domain-containing protein n=1 Tax=Desulfovulcanus ferrireducens TaxID=2831190 RepID=UPI00207BC944|nr:DUF4388 domain-containing protein [Desulfovulcanus ferrireducens]MBT8763742.1 DUF4388 domain-containing protein [Desulfovulcanus ferrireducens]